MAHYNRMRYVKRTKQHQNNHLAAGITLENVIDAFTNPEDRFEFPIKAMTFEMGKESQNTIILAALILGASGMAIAAIVKK